MKQRAAQHEFASGIWTIGVGGIATGSAWLAIQAPLSHMCLKCLLKVGQQGLKLIDG